MSWVIPSGSVLAVFFLSLFVPNLIPFEFCSCCFLVAILRFSYVLLNVSWLIWSTLIFFVPLLNETSIYLFLNPVPSPFTIKWRAARLALVSVRDLGRRRLEYLADLGGQQQGRSLCQNCLRRRRQVRQPHLPRVRRMSTWVRV